MIKPERISYDDFIKSVTMFWIDRDLEETIQKEVDEFVNAMATKLTSINTKEGLIRYIQSDKSALNNILGLMEIPEEKFKRIISLLRKERKYTFSTEWSLDKTRSIILENPSFMDDVCELLMNGAYSEKFKRKIPDFYRDSFKIDASTMARLTDRDELSRLAKHQIEVKYNNGVSLVIAKKIEEAIKLTCDLEGLTYVKNKNVDLFEKSYSFIIPNEHSPKILIDYSYNITTSSTQSRLKEKIINTKKDAVANQQNVITVVILEGAGWVGRQSDLKIIYENADYVLNLVNLGLLDQIIRYGMEE